MNLLDFLFPPRCLSCQATGSYFCPDCQKNIIYIKRQVCPQCGRASIQGETHPACRTHYSLDGLVKAFYYKKEIREVIKRIKFEPYVFNAIPVLTSLAMNYFEKDDGFIHFREFLKTKPKIVAVPLSRKRFRERGFNQAQLIGQELAKQWDLTLIKDLIKRIKNTKPQYSLERKERRENIKGAFAINPAVKKNLTPSPLLLVDDIWTSGVTMREVARVLKISGFKKIWGLVISAR